MQQGAISIKTKRKRNSSCALVKLQEKDAMMENTTLTASYILKSRDENLLNVKMQVDPLYVPLTDLWVWHDERPHKRDVAQEEARK